MPNSLAELTDSYDSEVQDAMPVENPYRRVPVYKSDDIVAEDKPERPSKTSVIINDVINKLFRDDDKRYQLWPEKVVRSALTAVPDAYSGKIPMHDIDPDTGEAKPSMAMIERSMDMASFAGTGGLGGTGKEAGMSLGIVPVDVAKKLGFKSGKPNDILKQAVENTPAANIDADGHLIVNMVRHQGEEQALAESVRGGVFYLPEGSPNARHYNGTTNNNYGGSQKIEGQTAYKNPLVVKGATGGKAPEMAYNELMGDKKAYSNLDKDVMEVVTANNWMRKKDPAAFDDLITRYLDKHAPELRDYGDYIINNSNKGNQLRYALSEAAIASAARKAGYDGIVGYSVGRGPNKGKPFLSEIFDVRESHYPNAHGDYQIHPDLLSDSSLPGGAVAASTKNRAFLRPALKYKDKLYKGKEGQQHMDVIPEALYPEFQKMAMSGEDISHYNFGFVNDKGHFLDREKALKYGIDTGLIDPQAGKFGALTSTLMADSSKPGVAIEAMKASPFFSAVEHNLKAIPQTKMTGDQWLGTLSNKPGVKPEELDWTGLKSFLEENKGKVVTKDQISEHLAANKVELKEVSKGGNTDPYLSYMKDSQIAHELKTSADIDLAKKHNANFRETFKGMSDREILKLAKEAEATKDIGPTKYHSYQLPGGENYREMLLTLPKKSDAAFAKEYQAKTGVDISSYPSDQITNLRRNSAASEVGGDYKSSHWDEPNILAHVRMNDRTIDGKKSLHLEEIQSDWHQQGRDKGYGSGLKEGWKTLKLENGEYSLYGPQDKQYPIATGDKDAVMGAAKRFGGLEQGVPDAPFKKSWHELALKRMIREAAEKGYDRLSWTPGEAQAARYDLSKSIDSLQFIHNRDHVGDLTGFKNGSPILVKRINKIDELKDAIGKEAAEKLMSKEANKGNGVRKLENADLKIGGEGMKGFYDQILPKAIEKLGKEHGVKVKQGSVNDKFIIKNKYGIEAKGGKTEAEAKEALKAKPVDENWKVEKENNSIHYIDIPQSLRDTAMNKGFPLFSKGFMFSPVDYEPEFK